MYKSILVISLLMLVAACSKTSILQPIKTGHEGEGIPKLSLLLLGNKSFYSTADLPRGKTNVLFYFSPVCPHCRVQMRTIVDNMHRLKDVQFTILTIADYPSTRPFYDRYKLNRYSNVAIGIDTGYIFPNYFKIDKVPFLAIYKNGVLKDAFIGSISFDQLNHEIQSNVIAQSNRP